MNQDLFDEIKPHIVRNFLKYHAENPHVYELFKKFAYQAKNTNRTLLGIGAICERIRWYVAVETTGDVFKINNNYRSCYARLLMSEDESFKTFFRRRSTY